MFLFPFSPKYIAEDNSTLDPQKLNASFRDAAQKIKYVQSLKYTYSVMQYDLLDMDFSKPSEERRFIIRPPSDCEIVGAHLSVAGLTGEQTITARWLSPADTTVGGSTPLSGQIALIQASESGGVGTATPSASNVSLPSGGETVSWDYLDVERKKGFNISEDITQRVLRLTANQNYILEMRSSDSTLVLNSDKPASITVWLRTNRGSYEGWKMMELLDGSDIPYVTPPAAGDPRGIGDIVSELNAQATLSMAAANKDTFRCDVVRVGGGPNITVGTDSLNRELGQRIPRTVTLMNNGPTSGANAVYRTNTAWSLHRVDIVLVSSDNFFCSTNPSQFNAVMEIKSDGSYEPPVSGNTNFYKIADPQVGRFNTNQYKEVFIQGQNTVAWAPAAGNPGKEGQINSDTVVGGQTVNPLNPAHDLYFDPTISSSTETVAVAYMYIWYKLTP